MEKKSYKSQLDGIRAICIVLTIFNHIPAIPSWINGSVGVDVFFALSGWLITYLLLNEMKKGGRIDLTGFYIRRFFRIVPLYIVTISIYYVLSSLMNTVANDPKKLIEFNKLIVYLITFSGEYIPEGIGNLFGHSWTLGIEEKFYILWPAVLLVWASRPILAPIIGFAALGILFGYGLGVHESFLIRGYFGLAFGAGMSLLVHTQPTVLDFLKRRAIAAPVAGLIFASYLGSIEAPLPIVWNVLISLFAAPMIASLWVYEDQATNRLLKFRPLAWLGTLTYATYLIQSIMIAVGVSLLNKIYLPSEGFTLFAVAYPLCIATAYLLHVAIEAPLINLGRSIGKMRATGEVQAA